MCNGSLIILVLCFYALVRQFCKLLVVLMHAPFWKYNIYRFWCKTVVTSLFYLTSYNGFAPSSRYMFCIFFISKKYQTRKADDIFFKSVSCYFFFSASQRFTTKLFFVIFALLPIIKTDA